MIKTDTSFNEAILKEVLPAISSAFNKLNADYKSGRLKESEKENKIKTALFNQKAADLKKILNKYVDSECEKYLNSFTLNEVKIND